MDRLSAMEALVRVIETGSFSGAARQLRIGQPAVSKAIAQIEERLGVRLLLRTTHGLSPTESGQNFYERAKRAIAEVEEADLAARGAGPACLAGYESVRPSRLHASTSCRSCQPFSSSTRRSLSTSYSMIETSISSRPVSTLHCAWAR